MEAVLIFIVREGEAFPHANNLLNHRLATRVKRIIECKEGLREGAALPSQLSPALVVINLSFILHRQVRTQIIR